MRVEPAATPLGIGEYERDRRRLLGELRGSVLEIGAGAGTNLPLLSADVEWTGLEPARGRRRRLARRRPASTVLAAPAEQVPLPDASLDAVFGTKVLCSVADQHRVLHEVLRLLRPGGRFVFFEHVVAPVGTWTRSLQHLIAPLTRRLDHGCDPTRETWGALERAGFSDLRIDWYTAGSWRLIGGYGVA